MTTSDKPSLFLRAIFVVALIFTTTKMARRNRDGLSDVVILPGNTR